MPTTSDDQLGFVPDAQPSDLGFVPDASAPTAKIPDVGFIPDSAVVVRDAPEARTPQLGGMLTRRVLGDVANEEQRDVGPTIGAVGKFARAIPADVMAKIAGAPEFGGNIDAALTGSRQVGPTLVPGTSASGEPTIQTQTSARTIPAPQMPIDKAIDLASEDAKSREQFPWASIAAKASQGVFAAAPKMAALPLAGEALPAQMLASGVLFSVDDNGQFHPSEVPFNALLPGVGKAARVATGAAIGAAISKGATSLENPLAQKVFEEIGDQAALNALMMAQQSPQMVQLWKTNKNAFYQRLADTVGQNLAMRIGLGGIGDFSPDKNSQTRNFVDANADLFTQRTLARAVGGDLARQLNTAPPEQPGPARQPVAEDVSSPAGFASQVPQQPEKLDLAGEPAAKSGTIVPEQPAATAHPALPAVNKLADAVEELRAALANPFKPEKPAGTSEPATESGTIVPEQPPITNFPPEKGDIKTPMSPEEVAQRFGPRPLTESTEGETTNPGAAAETITGQNEQIGSEAPAAATSAAEPMPAEGLENPQKPRPPSGGKNPFWLRSRSDGVPDILDSIQELGGIRPPGPNAGGEYDGFREAMTGPARMLIRKGAAHAPDTIIGELQAIGAPGANRIQTTDDLWEQISAAVKSRDGLRKTEIGQRAEAKQISEFQRRAVQGDRPKKEAGTYARVPVGSMLEGDTFKVQNHSFTVRHLDFDPDGNLISVEVKDGPKFGVQRLDGNEFIHVDKGSFEAGPNHDSGPPPELAPAAKRPVPNNSQVGDARPSAPPMELKDDAPEYKATTSKLEALSQDVHGKSYAELEPWQQDAIRQAAERETVPRREQPRNDERREPANPGEPPGEGTPLESKTSPIQQARAEADPIQAHLDGLMKERDRLETLLKSYPRDKNGSPTERIGIGTLAQLRHTEGQIDLLREIAQAPAGLKAKWLKKLLEEDAPDAIQRTLDRLIGATDPLRPLRTGEVGMAVPKWATKAVINTALKIVRAAYTGGKAIAEAVQEGVAWLRDQNLKGFDQDEAHVFLLKAIHEEKSAPAYSELQANVREASDNLKNAVRVNGSIEARKNAGKTKAETKAEMNLAGARYHKARAELLSHPDYVRDVLQQHEAAVNDLTAAKAAGDDARTEELGRRVEQLQDEMKEMPARLLKSTAKDLFKKGQPGTTEKVSGSGLPDVAPSAERATPAAEERAGDMPSDRLKRAVAELPAKARDFFSGIRETRRKIGAKLATLPNRDLISYTKGAADNRAMVSGKETSNFILHELNRAFGATGDRVDSRNELREQALTFVVESGRNPRMLDDFRHTIEGSEHRYSTWAQRALQSIEYARANWDRLQNVAETYEKFTDAEHAAEAESGISTTKISGGYVFHLQDVMENWALPEAGSGAGGGAAAPFKHIREHNTYADAIANGVSPKTLNAVDLLQRRITLGRKLINYRAWIDSMRRVVDPATQLPVVTDTIVRTRADGTSDTTAPPGYGVESFAGQQVAVHKGYDGLFSALTGDDWFGRGTVRPFLAEAATTSKHLQLAFDTYHLGRMAFWNSMVRGATEGGPGMFLPGNPVSYKRGLTLLDNSPADIRAMAERGEIPKEWADGLVEQKRRLGVLLNAGYNIGHSADNIYSHWIEKLPVAAQFNRWLFQKYVRGAMSEAGLIELARQQKMNPELSEAQVARRVAQDLNKRFGNLNNESWIKSKTGQSLARMIVLAPSWNEGLIRSEIGAVKQLAMTPVQSFKAKRLSIGTLGRATSVAVVGQFIANQILNYATRGQPTWQNKEEGSTSKLSAFIPDVVGNGPGFFLNPLTLPMEMSNLLLKKTERTGDVTQAARETVSSRLNTLSRSAWTFVTREDQSGAKLKTGGAVLREMGSNLVPLPLSGSAVARAAKQLVTGEPEEKFPGQFERQAFQTFGAKLESAPSDEQRIKTLATAYNKDHGITPDAGFSHSDYYDLDRAILIGNQRDTQQALADLLEKKTSQEIQKHYNTYMRAPYTGKLSRENDFKMTLNPEQLETYDRARQRREEVRAAVTDALSSMPASASDSAP
jgi:hypothetical protein